jgi:hypothetical protein
VLVEANGGKFIVMASGVNAKCPQPGVNGHVPPVRYLVGQIGGAWRPGRAQLLMAEAFITAAGEPEPLSASQHAADAAAAGLAMLEVLDSPAAPTSSVCCSPQDSFNMLAAMALWAGL